MLKRLIHWVLGILLIVASASCRPSIEKGISSRIASLSGTTELGTVEYTVRKIVRASDNQIWTVGDRKILFSTTSYLKAGVKLDGFSEDNVSFNRRENSITVTLPKASLLSFNMPPEEIRTEYESYGVFRSRFSKAEQNKILRLGEERIRKDIDNLGILNEAEKNTTDFFVAMFNQIGIEKVNVIFE